MSRPISRRAVLQSSMAAAMMAGAPSVVAGQAPRVLRVRMANDLVSLDPVITRSLTDICAIIGVLNKLVVYKSSDSWEWRLDAAQSIEQVDPTHVKFTVRPGIMWTNGFGEMTAEDVKYSFERMIDPKLKSNNAPGLEAAGSGRRGRQVHGRDRPQGAVPRAVPRHPDPLGGHDRVEEGRGVGGRLIQDRAAGDLRAVPPEGVAPQGPRSCWPGTRGGTARARTSTRSTSARSAIRRPPSSRYEAGEIDVTDIAVSSVPKFQKAPPPAHGSRAAAGRHRVDRHQHREPRVQGRAGASRRPAGGGHAGRASTPPTSAWRSRPRASSRPGSAGTAARSSTRTGTWRARSSCWREAGVPNGFPATLSVLNNTDIVTVAQVIQANLADVGHQARDQALRVRNVLVAGRRGARAPTGRTSSSITRSGACRRIPANMMQWFLPEQIGVWNWERWNDAEFAAMHKQALSEMDPKKRDRPVPPDAGPDGGVGRLRLAHQRRPGHDVPHLDGAGDHARRALVHLPGLQAGWLRRVTLATRHGERSPAVEPGRP